MTMGFKVNFCSIIFFIKYSWYHIEKIIFNFFFNSSLQDTNNNEKKIGLKIMGSREYNFFKYITVTLAVNILDTFTMDRGIFSS